MCTPIYTDKFVRFILGITSIGGMFCGFLSNHIDIAPNYAGTLMAITNTAATLPGIIMPLFVGAVTHGNVSEITFYTVFFLVHQYI